MKTPVVGKLSSRWQVANDKLPTTGFQVFQGRQCFRNGSIQEGSGRGGGWYSFQKAEASAMAAGTPAA